VRIIIIVVYVRIIIIVEEKQQAKQTRQETDTIVWYMYIYMVWSVVGNDGAQVVRNIITEGCTGCPG
jgi:hypothetical protein